MELLPRFLFISQLLLAFNPTWVTSARILSIAFLSSKSQFLSYEPLLIALAEKGHQLTVASPVKPKEHTNIRYIKTFDTATLLENTSPRMYEDQGRASTFQMYLRNNYIKYLGFGVEACKQSYSIPEVLALKEETFDLIFFPNMWNDCVYGLLHEIKAPVVLFNQISIFPWVSANFGNPGVPSFAPFIYYDFGESMSFLERVLNFLGVLYYDLAKKYIMEPRMEEIYQSVLGDHVPSIGEIERNSSLVLVNTHINFVPPRPLTPDIIEVGGLGLRDPQPLPKELEDFYTGAEHGVIVVSFGSILKASQMPTPVRDSFIKAFAKLQQRVLWKWEGDAIPGISSNVKLSKWLPQPDVLGHNGTKLFITHGGHGSISESLYAGVPMIGIPIIAEQRWNVKQLTLKGYGLGMDFKEITEESLLDFIRRVLGDKSYQETVKLASQLYKEGEVKPMERAIYWLEYVIRYQGAVHLRSKGRDLNFIQYYSLDVILLLGFLFISLGLLMFTALRFLIRSLLQSISTVPRKLKEKKSQ